MTTASVEIYGPPDGFNADTPFYKLLLYDTQFFLYKIIYKPDDLYEQYQYSGTWQIKSDHTLIFTATNYEEQKLKGYTTITHTQTTVNKKITARRKTTEHKIFLNLKAFGNTITLKTYNPPPTSLHHILAGSYTIEQDYYSSELLLSTPHHGEYGDYEDYFHLSVYTIGQCGYGQYDTYFEIKGRYTIKNDKLCLHYSYALSREGIDKPALVSIIEPVTIPVTHVIEDSRVRLSFTLGDITYAFEKYLH